jgi:hypothetical protein
MLPGFLVPKLTPNGISCFDEKSEEYMNDGVYILIAILFFLITCGLMAVCGFLMEKH